MNKIMKMLVKNDAQRFQSFIKEIKENDKKKAFAYTNRSSYISLSSLKFSCTDEERVRYAIRKFKIKADPCPV